VKGLFDWIVSRSHCKQSECRTAMKVRKLIGSRPIDGDPISKFPILVETLMFNYAEASETIHPTIVFSIIVKQNDN